MQEGGQRYALESRWVGHGLRFASQTEDFLTTVAF